MTRSLAFSGIYSTTIMQENVESKTCRTIILVAVLCGCETWSVSLREEHRLRVFENGGSEIGIGSKREEETGDWREFHSEELHDLYCLPDIIRVIKQGG